MSKRKEIRVVIVEPNKAPYESQIGNDLASMQGIVGGYIEAVGLNQNLVLICNEEGKLLGLPPNRVVGNDIIVGTFFITRTNSMTGDFIDLTNDDVRQIIEFWR